MLPAPALRNMQQIIMRTHHFAEHKRTIPNANFQTVLVQVFHILPEYTGELGQHIPLQHRTPQIYVNLCFWQQLQLDICWWQTLCDGRANFRAEACRISELADSGRTSFTMVRDP